MANLKYVHLHTYIHTTFCMMQGAAALMNRYGYRYHFKVSQTGTTASTGPLRGSLWRAAAGGEDQWGGRFPLGRVAWDLVVSGIDHFDLKILNFELFWIYILKIYKYTLICFHVSIVFPPWFLMLLLPSYHDVGLGWLGKCWFKLSDVRRPWAKGGSLETQSPLKPQWFSMQLI